MLIALGYIMVNFFSLNFTDLIILEQFLTFEERIVLFVFLFIGFSIKIPMFPFHLWLPEAHVEAPTIGSIILAGILLKLGGYGMLRFLVPIFPQTSFYLKNFIFVIAVISVLYSCFIGFCQVDLKKIVAYSSITHMNFSVPALFAFDPIAIEGAVYSMFSHGLISTALFFLVGVLYDRFKTRLIYYYGGLASVMPMFAFVLFFFVLANVGIPPLSGFVAELLILLGLVALTNKFLIILIFISTILLTINFFWFFNRLCMGPVSPHLSAVSDLNSTELAASFFLIVYVLFLGFWPAVITFPLHDSVIFIVATLANVPV